MIAHERMSLTYDRRQIILPHLATTKDLQHIPTTKPGLGSPTGDKGTRRVYPTKDSPRRRSLKYRRRFLPRTDDKITRNPVLYETTRTPDEMIAHETKSLTYYRRQNLPHVPTTKPGLGNPTEDKATRRAYPTKQSPRRQSLNQLPTTISSTYRRKQKT